MCTIFGRTGILRDIVITSPFVESFDTEWSRLDDSQWKQSAQNGVMVDLKPAAASKGKITPLCKYELHIGFAMYVAIV